MASAQLGMTQSGPDDPAALDAPPPGDEALSRQQPPGRPPAEFRALAEVVWELHK